MQVKLTEREFKILECFRKNPELAMECLKKVLSERKEYRRQLVNVTGADENVR